MLAFYMFRQLRRSDDALWRILAEKDRQLRAGEAREAALTAELTAARVELVRARTELAFWRGSRLSAEDAAALAVEQRLDEQHQLPPTAPGAEPGGVASSGKPKRSRRRRAPG